MVSMHVSMKKKCGGFFMVGRVFLGAHQGKIPLVSLVNQQSSVLRGYLMLQAFSAHMS